jgi:hypothetical protein
MSLHLEKTMKNLGARFVKMASLVGMAGLFVSLNCGGGTGGTGSGGSSGTGDAMGGAGGMAGSAAGSAGQGGGPGAGGAGTTSCSGCDKAAACCIALNTMFGIPDAGFNCNASYATAACDALPGAAQGGYITDCNTELVTGSLGYKLAACM